MNVLRAGGHPFAGEDAVRDKENAPHRYNTNHASAALNKQHPSQKSILGAKDTNVGANNGKFSRPSLLSKESLLPSPRVSYVEPRVDVQMVDQFSQGIFVHLKGIEVAQDHPSKTTVQVMTASNGRKI